MGKTFGMIDFINSSESNKPISKLVYELIEGESVDYSFECIGIQSLINEVLQATKVVHLWIHINVNHDILLHIKLKLSYLYKFLLGWLYRNHGKGMLILIGVGNKESMDINFWTLLLGTTIKGCLFGGIKVQSDVP